MELNFNNNIGNWLSKLEPLSPIPTELAPSLNNTNQPPVKAVIFDIYGTLLISSSGDIDQATLNFDHLKEAMRAAGFKIDTCQPKLCSFLLEQLREKIADQHQILKEKGHPYPDVDIFEVWKNVFLEAEKRGYLRLNGLESWSDLIFIFEVLSNKVYPMPGMKEILHYLQEQEIPIGIVSNAQFYTPIIMNYLLTGNLSYKQEIDGFHPDLCIYSFKELRAKPDTALFDKLKPTLMNKYHIQPGECVFIGNDMLKDVYTAHQSGLQTALFAGDQRSLRLRTDDPKVKGIKPDYIITELLQIKEIVRHDS